MRNGVIINGTLVITISLSAVAEIARRACGPRREGIGIVYIGAGEGATRRRDSWSVIGNTACLENLTARRSRYDCRVISAIDRNIDRPCRAIHCGDRKAVGKRTAYIQRLHRAVAVDQRVIPNPG